MIVERIIDNRTPFYRPPLPQQESEGVHPGILTLMKQCWAEEPTERPSFVDVAKAIKNVNKGRSYISIPDNFFNQQKHESVCEISEQHFYARQLYRQVLLRTRINYLWEFCLSVCLSRPGTDSRPGEI